MAEIVDASHLLSSLADRVAALAAPGELHPDVRAAGARADAWAVSRGLVLGDPDSSPLGRARFERLAGRLFPAAAPDRVTLAARWLVWTFALDDAIDDGPLGRSATAVHGLYTDLLNALRRGHAKPEARPLECALDELWRETTPGMSRAWRRRFLRHLEEHRDGCTAEAVNRRTGCPPDLAGYPRLRRQAAAPFLYDLVEPVLGAELPAELVTGRAWQALLDGTADLITWANDVVSVAKEAACRGGPGEVIHNHVAVVCATYRLEPEHAARWVVDYIVARAPDVQDAARALAAELDRLRLDDETRAQAAAAVRTLLNAPRAHLDWLAETGRYIVARGDTVALPARAAQGRLRLDALAALR